MLELNGKTVSRLKGCHVQIKEKRDTLVWFKNPDLGFYTPKLGYKAMFGEERPENIQWC